MSQIAHTHATDEDAESCPYCGHEITHDELISIEQRIEKEQQEKFVAREKQLNAQHMSAMSELHKQIAAKDDAAQTQIKALTESNQKALAAKDSEREKLIENALNEERKKINNENTLANANILKERNEFEEKFNKLTSDKESEKKSHQAELLQQRKVMEADTEKKLLSQKADSDKVTYRLTQKLADVQKQLEKKSNDELGDGAEVELYNDLKAAFPDDTIIRVKKGTPGADIKHEVIVGGRSVGKIVYDSKNRSNWRSAYAEQLRKDQLAEKADHAILATRKFPKDTRELTEYDGVLLVNPARATVLAGVVRESLIRLSTIKLSEQSKQDKKEKLYEFITSSRCNNLFERVEHEISHLRDLDVTEKKQQEKMRKDRAKHVSEMEKTVLGDLLNEIQNIIEI